LAVIVWLLDLQLPMQSVPITTDVTINLFSPWYSWTNCWVGVKQQSLTHSLKCIYNQNEGVSLLCVIIIVVDCKS
jgi:hypothetical protein